MQSSQSNQVLKREGDRSDRLTAAQDGGWVATGRGLIQQRSAETSRLHGAITAHRWAARGRGGMQKRKKEKKRRALQINI